eukprot:gene22826-52110_t
MGAPRLVLVAYVGTEQPQRWRVDGDVSYTFATAGDLARDAAAAHEPFWFAPPIPGAAVAVLPIQHSGMSRTYVGRDTESQNLFCVLDVIGNGA